MTAENPQDADGGADARPGDQKPVGDSSAEPDIGTQVNINNINTNAPERDFFHIVFSELDKLPHYLHSFQAPNHERLVGELRERRFLVLKSYRRHAAFSAGFMLTSDPVFDSVQRRLLRATIEWSKDTRDQDVMSVVTDKRVDHHVVIAPINRKCQFLDSIMSMELGTDDLARRLKEREAYLILAVDDVLWDDEWHDLTAHSVSHFSYLLKAHGIEDRDAELARRFDLVTKQPRGRAESDQLYALVAERIAQGRDAVEAYLQERPGVAAPIGRPVRPVISDQTAALVDTESLAHRTALFVAAFLPELGETEFDALVVQLLSDQVKTSTVERSVIDAEGMHQTVTETREEAWTVIYTRDVDAICRDCRLTVARQHNGLAIVDFAEPHLRLEVREQFKDKHPRFVRRQVLALQSSGILFADLSEDALDALIDLFVERAREDPRISGEVWLAQMANALHARLKGDLPEGSVPQQLGWLIGKALAEIQLRRFLYGRMSLLVREMLDREELRPTVEHIFTALIASNREEALLEVVLSLLQQLSYAPHFDPVMWLGRLLNQSSPSVQERAAEKLFALATRKGSRGPETTKAIRGWLPGPDRSERQFSPAQVIALQFPYRLSQLVDPDEPDAECLDAWADRLPFFAMLLTADQDATPSIRDLVQWTIDGRRAWRVTDSELPPREQDQAQAARLATLIETWARALAGARLAATGTKGAQLLELLLRELVSATSADDRTLMLRHWQKEADGAHARAVEAASAADRSRFLRRERRLSDLSARLKAAAVDQQSVSAASQATRPNEEAR